MLRRDLLKGLAGGLIGATVVSNSMAQTRRRPDQRRPRMKKYTNADFYKDGVFQADVAKKAYLEMFDRFHYSLTDSLKDNPEFWVAEFESGDFERVGMGGIFWVNDKEHGYFGHEIFLLPNQMIPEHFHLAAEDMPAKHEAWQVRYGSIFNFAQGGEKTDAVLNMLPKSQLDQDGITCFTFEELKVGDFRKLRTLCEPHFMMGGPNGAIVTEYACWHSAKGLGFTNKNLKN
ncbi:MAG: hypothetical protein Q4C95_02885 [Planctomycetia bacterium]|nr:hypothetical protein [Planctomycetia bacterium]